MTGAKVTIWNDTNLDLDRRYYEVKGSVETTGQYDSGEEGDPPPEKTAPHTSLTQKFITHLGLSDGFFDLSLQRSEGKAGDGPEREGDILGIKITIPTVGSNSYDDTGPRPAAHRYGLRVTYEPADWMQHTSGRDYTDVEAGFRIIGEDGPMSQYGGRWLT